jgi:hypothetical protein
VYLKLGDVRTVLDHHLLCNVADFINVFVCIVGRYPKPCYRKDGDVLTARCVRVVANHMMKVDLFYVMNVISVITFTALIHLLMPSQLVPGSVSGA